MTTVPERHSATVTLSRTRTIVETATVHFTVDPAAHESPQPWTEDAARTYAAQQISAGTLPSPDWATTDTAQITAPVVEQVQLGVLAPADEPLRYYDVTLSGTLGVPTSATPKAAVDGRIVGFTLSDGTAVAPHIILELHSPETDTYTDLTYRQATARDLILEHDLCECTERGSGA